MNIRASSLHAPLSKLAIAVAVISLSSNAMAADSLQRISTSQPSSQVTELNLDFGQKPVMPVAFQMENPSRLVLDFNNIGNKLPRTTEINQGNIKNVTAIANNTTTRLVINLNQAGQYTTRVENNRLIIAILDPNAPVDTAQASDTTIAPTTRTVVQSPVPVVVQPIAPPVTVQPVMVEPIAPVVVENTPIISNTISDNNRIANSNNAPDSVQPVMVEPIAPVTKSRRNRQVKTEVPAPETMVVKVNPLLNPTGSTSQQYNYDGLTSLNYTASSTGGGSVSIGLTNESIPLDVQRAGDELVIRMSGATIPSRLVRQSNQNGGLIKSVITNNQGKNGVIRIAMNGDYEYKAYQTGNQLSITIEPPKKLREPTLEERTYKGAPLSMEFQDVSVRNVLELIGQHTNTNIVASDTVSGNITLRLINVPWDQALDIILKSKNLDKRINGNVVWVAPATELQTQEATERKAQNDAVELAPLRTEYIRLNYAIANDIKTLIEAGRTANTTDRNTQGSLLSARGTVTVDNRTNTIIVKDTSDSITSIRDLLSKLDIPVKQVMIEARIVSATDSFSKEMGVKWGILSNGIATNRNLLVGGSETTINDLKNYTINTQTVNGQTVSYPKYTITTPNNLNVDLGAANPAGSIAFGLLSMSDMLIDLELSAMQADGKGEVISTPKVLTADKQTAKVMSGTQIPYQEASASGASTTSFKDAALSLEVTPNITPEGRIAMKLSVQNSRPNFSTNPPAIDTDSINTNVIVDDGQTVVLGGVFKDTLGNSVTKVPFFGDLPYVGNLFKKTSKNNSKQELLIFVTPKLVNDTVNRIN